MKRKGIFYTILSAVLFGVTPLITRSIYAYQATPITVVFFRSLFILPILWLLMKKKHISLALPKQQIARIGFIAVFGSGMTTILLFTAYTYIDSGTATTLHFLYPLFVSLLCFCIYKERLSKQKLIALCIALSGTSCFFIGSKGGTWYGYVLAIASSITYAFYMVQLEKTRLTHENAYLVSFYIAIFIVGETLLYHLITPVIHFQLPLMAYLLLIVLGIVSSFLAVVLLQLGIKLLGSSTASLFCLFEPITSVVSGCLFLNESLNFAKIAGCSIIFVALIMITVTSEKPVA